MITDERTAAYIDSLSPENSPFLSELERSAVEAGVPIIRRPARSLLRFIIAERRPDSILEIGTAVGFSAILMATCGPQDLHIDTIENYEKHITAARQNIAAAGMEDRITLIEGDAGIVLKELAGEQKSYDMIFIDGAKAQYPAYFDVCRNLLRPNGVLVADNVLFDGDIVRSRFAVRRRDRTIHARLREFLRTLTADPEFVTTVLPIGDGMTLSVKQQ